jgi:hypothetical protein
MFAETLSGSVFLAVCENVFQTRLLGELASRAPNADPSLVLSNGDSGLRAAMSKLYDAQTVDNILASFVTALQPVWIIGVLLASLSVLGSLATEWVSVNHEDGQGKQEETALQSDIRPDARNLP